jgi:hypothetical protein
MKKLVLSMSLFIILLSCASAEESFYGKYVSDNQAKYDTEKRWIEISRNQYQEIIINSEYYSNAIAYYDIENQELFFVIVKPAQYNTLMKIKIINKNTIEVYMLAQNKWTKSSYIFKK